MITPLESVDRLQNTFTGMFCRDPEPKLLKLFHPTKMMVIRANSLDNVFMRCKLLRSKVIRSESTCLFRYIRKKIIDVPDCSCRTTDSGKSAIYFNIKCLFSQVYAIFNVCLLIFNHPRNRLWSAQGKHSIAMHFQKSKCVVCQQFKCSTVFLNTQDRKDCLNQRKVSLELRSTAKNNNKD